MIVKILSLFVVLISLGTVGYFGGLNFLPIDEGMALLPPQIRDVIDDIDDLVPNEIKKLAGNIDAENIATTVPSIPIIISDPTSFEEPDLKGQAPGETAPLPIVNPTELERLTIEKINLYREGRSLPTWDIDPIMLKDARRHAQYMAIEDFFGHGEEGVTFSERLERVGAQCSSVSSQVLKLPLSNDDPSALSDQIFDTLLVEAERLVNSPRLHFIGLGVSLESSKYALVSMLASVQPSTPNYDEVVMDDLLEHALLVINQDREKFSLRPVVLGQNKAAQLHAEDLLSHGYLSHWDSAGRKPYMMYSIASGTGSVSENAALQGSATECSIHWGPEDILDGIESMQFQMVYNDLECCDNGHRDTILDVHHNVVHIGLAWNGTQLFMVQHFANEYVEWNNYPNLNSNGIVSLSGDASIPISGPLVLAIAYDPIPTGASLSDLRNSPNFYSIGEKCNISNCFKDPNPWIGSILQPLPEGRNYVGVRPTDVVANVWNVNEATGQFEIQANIIPIVNAHGSGVYTLIIQANTPDRGSLVLLGISFFIG